MITTDRAFGLYSLLPLTLSLLLMSACAGQSPVYSPRLLDEGAFLSDMSRARSKGAITAVAPASGLDSAEFKKIRELTARLGINFPPEAVAFDLVPYNANTDEVRQILLEEALHDHQTRVVWAVRGGYGASRILGALSRPSGAKKKIFIGYSDMTFVHLFLGKADWPTIHGAMLKEMGDPAKDRDNFRLLAGLLSGRLTELNYNVLKPFNSAARQSTRPIRAAVTGGNLTCLAASLGTPWPLEAAGQILFLEDVGEPGYKIDRMLTQLQAAGKLKRVRAVILGEFVGGDEHTEYALKRFADSFDRPVFRAPVFGHGASNYPLVFNVPAVINPGEYDEPYGLSIKVALP